MSQSSLLRFFGGSPKREREEEEGGGEGEPERAVRTKAKKVEAVVVPDNDELSDSDFLLLADEPDDGKEKELQAPETPASSSASVRKRRRQTDLGTAFADSVTAAALQEEASGLPPDLCAVGSRQITDWVSALEARAVRFPFLIPDQATGPRTPTSLVAAPQATIPNLYIDPQHRLRLTSFDRQYWDIKCEHMSSLVAFTKGPFYEFFDADALRVSSLVGTKVSLRSAGLIITGLHENSADAAFGKLLAAGYTVVVVGQEASRAQRDRDLRTGRAQGSTTDLLVRKVTARLSRGTVTHQDMTPPDATCYCAVLSVVERRLSALTPAALEVGVAAFDATVGSLVVGQVADWDETLSQIRSVLARLAPVEVVLEGDGGIHGALAAAVRSTLPHAQVTVVPAAAGDFCTAHARRLLDLECTQRNESIPPLLVSLLDDPTQEAASSALGGALSFASSAGLLYALLRAPAVHSLASVDAGAMPDPDASRLILDHTALTSLHIVRNEVGTEAGTLLAWLAPHTSTPMGKRVLRAWLTSPLRSPPAIRTRQAIRRALSANGATRDRLRGRLRQLPDLDRLVGSVLAQRATVRSFVDTLDALASLSSIDALLRSSSWPDPTDKTNSASLLPSSLPTPLPDLTPSLACLSLSLSLSETRERGRAVLPAGRSAGYDEALAAQAAVEVELQSELERARQAFGTRSVRFAHVGNAHYLLEVPKRESKLAPPEYKVETGTSTVRRFSSLCLSRLASAHDDTVVDLDTAARLAFRRILAECSNFSKEWRSAGAYVGELDALLSLSLSADEMVEPTTDAVFLPDHPEEEEEGERERERERETDTGHAGRTTSSPVGWKPGLRPKLSLSLSLSPRHRSHGSKHGWEINAPSHSRKQHCPRSNRISNSRALSLSLSPRSPLLSDWGWGRRSRCWPVNLCP
jgi:DNA mismatch repair protein MSH6